MALNLIPLRRGRAAVKEDAPGICGGPSDPRRSVLDPVARGERTSCTAKAAGGAKTHRSRALVVEPTPRELDRNGLVIGKIAPLRIHEATVLVVSSSAQAERRRATVENAVHARS